MHSCTPSGGRAVTGLAYGYEWPCSYAFSCAFLHFMHMWIYHGEHENAGGHMVTDRRRLILPL